MSRLLLVRSFALRRRPSSQMILSVQFSRIPRRRTMGDCSTLSTERNRHEMLSLQLLRQTSSSRSMSSSSSQPQSSPKNTKNERQQQDSVQNADTSDPSMVTWVDEYLPSELQPYARLARMDKPIGTFLLLWPCYWSTALAAPPGALPDLKLLTLFGMGAFVMRGAGCTINDMWDQDFDKQVTRTRTRPLASGDLTQTQALGFLALQLSTGLGVLLSLPHHTWYCFQLGAASLPLVVAYPLMKRYTNWPQLVLGMTFNWGALMGWAATQGSLDALAVGPLYLSGVTWTLVYDTLYAHQDKADDATLGLKSTALYFGQDTKPILHGFAALSWLGWMASGYHVGYESLFFYGGTSLAYAHLVWQIQTANLNDAPNLAARFRSNQSVGAIVFVSIVAGNVMAAATT